MSNEKWVGNGNSGIKQKYWHTLWRFDAFVCRKIIKLSGKSVDWAVKASWAIAKDWIGNSLPSNRTVTGHLKTCLVAQSGLLFYRSISNE